MHGQTSLAFFPHPEYRGAGILTAFREMQEAHTGKAADVAFGSKGVGLTGPRRLPVYPGERTFSGWAGMSQRCQKRSFLNRSGRETAIPGALSGVQANQSISGPGAAFRRPLATEPRAFVR